MPGLTLHDEAHLSALWDRASQLAGTDFHLNPLEAFIFGGAVIRTRPAEAAFRWLV
ncbi:MAG: hypothetical protein WCC64_15765 [Aliidongia sp.]